MRRLFADTFYWVALFSPRDRWHRQALDISRTLGEHRLWTTHIPSDLVVKRWTHVLRAAQPVISR